MPERRKGMEIPQVSISVDTSDSGAQSIETCREVNSVENNSDEVNDGDTGGKLCVTKAESDLKRALACHVNNDIEKWGKNRAHVWFFQKVTELLFREVN